MLHPSGYYIRYLQAASWGDPDEPITKESLDQSLKLCGLLPMTDDQWEYYLSTFQPPNDFLFNNQRHTPTVEFMKQEKIFTVWKPNEPMTRLLTETLGEHGDRSYQHDLHILIMGDLPPDVIAEKLNKKYRLKRSLTEEMIILYQHYFWRRKSLTKPEWAEFLTGNPHFDHYMAPLLCGERQALFRAGMNPKYDYKAALREAHRQASFRIEYLGTMPDEKRMYDMWAKVLREERALYHILFGEGGGYEEKLKEVRHFIMTHSEKAVPALADLVGPNGSHSGDGTDEDQANKKGDQDAGNADA